ncbi:hypothetical protein Y032_0546g3266 [Ancylostoma ceylanicum]|uniref:Uncharacterized protein n=1 Tax=Ancylostoma ceylanicum TaxID=53326 RepID=A0A016WQJ6_9BILA|nr:hypothetical protein Y032_0546g3266 [Ancylostoma ceylanicum]
MSDLVFCYRILRGEIRLRASKYWIFRPSGPRSCAFNLHYPRINRKYSLQLFNSLFYRTARLFQQLPRDVFHSSSTAAFKSRLRKVDLSQSQNSNG